MRELHGTNIASHYTRIIAATFTQLLQCKLLCSNCKILNLRR